MLLTNSWGVDLFILLTTLLFALYKYMTRKFDYWEKRGVAYEKPVPFLGNLGDVFFMRRTIGLWLKRLYDQLPEHDFFGIFVFDEPRLVIRSKELAKIILIKDFNNFDNRTFAAPEHNEVERNWLFAIKNPDWKIVRSKMTALFTSGRLKKMFHLMITISEDMKTYMDKNLGDMELKNVCAFYAVDVIAQCAFGIKPNSFEGDSEFYRMGRRIWAFNLRNGIVQWAYLFKQNWVDIFKINFTEGVVEKYMYDVFMKTLSIRQGKVGAANDLIDIINELRENEAYRVHFEGPKVASQVMQFFQAGFETTSSTISYALYELCIHPEIQSRLRDEVTQSIDKHGGLTWDALNDLPYLEMVVAETLRKYPALPFLDRVCNDDYVIPGTDFVIEKGMNIYIPLFGLHFDEKHFPDPNKFDPERFAEGNPKVTGSFYLPFGDGPRNCIGERFGKVASKIAICQLIYNYEFVRNERTPDPVVFSPKSFLLQSEVGLPVTVKKYNRK